MAPDAAAAVADVYRADWGRIVATLIGLIGDFELAEEAAQEAFTAALEQWDTSGIPELPRAWIIKTARNKAVDRLRREARLAQTIAAYGESGLVQEAAEPDYDTRDIPDDRLRLIFTCCHPALALEAQVALTLRTLGGLDTDEIARAFLVAPPTMAQRQVRAKRKIREARIPYVVPETPDMPERLDAVLAVIYLVFNEGYAPTRGAQPMRTDLSAEAIRLGRLVRSLISPPPPEATALLALMLLHDSRRDARFDAAGDPSCSTNRSRAGTAPRSARRCHWSKRCFGAAPARSRCRRRSPRCIARRRARRGHTDGGRRSVRLYDRLGAHASPIVR